MMLTGYLIEKYSDMGNAYTCYRLMEEAQKCNVDLKMLGACDVRLTADGIFLKNEKVHPCDFVINRYKTGCIKEAINALAVKSYNAQDRLDIYLNKYNQLRDLHSTAFLLPKYQVGTLCAPFEEIESALGLPFIVKGLESSQGKEVYLIEKIDEYRELSGQWGNTKEVLFEEFIASSYGKDVRFYSIRGEVVACMTREAQDGFKANVALGANVRAYPITDDIRQIAHDIYRKTQLDFLGIDLLFGKDGFYFCEINVTPGMEGMERATGVNVAGMIMNTIKGDFKDE